MKKIELDTELVRISAEYIKSREGLPYMRFEDIINYPTTPEQQATWAAHVARIDALWKRNESKAQP